MRWYGYVGLLYIALPVAAFVALNAGLVEPKLQQLLTEKLGAPVQLGQLRVRPTWPLALEFGSTQVKHPAADLSWSRCRLEFMQILPPYGISVEVDGLTVVTKPQAPSPKRPTGGASSPSVVASPTTPPLHLKLKLINSQIRLNDLQISGLDLTFEQKELLQSQASLQLKGQVQWPQFPLPLPVTLESQTLHVSLDSVKASDMQISLASLMAKAEGASFLQEDRHRWKISLLAPDLAKLPQAPLNIPARNWRGSVRLMAEAIKDGATHPWSVEGDLQAQGVSAVVDGKHGLMRVQGPVRLNVRSKFSFFDGKTSVPVFVGDLDLTQANVQYQGMLDKRAGVPLLLQVDGKGNPEQFTLTNLAIQLWRMRLMVSADSQMRAPYFGRLSFNLPAIELAGLEKLILPLGKSPVRGELELRGVMKGALADPKQAHIHLEAIRFRGFSAVVNWANPTMKVQGPVQADFNAHAELDQGELKSIAGNGSLELKGLALETASFKKTAGQALGLRFNFLNRVAKATVASGQSGARPAVNTVHLSQLDVSGFFGSVQVKGDVDNPLEPILRNVSVQLAPLNLQALRPSLKTASAVVPDGVLTGKLLLNGSFAPDRDWNDWPLNVKGQVTVQIPIYRLAPAASSTSAQAKAPPPPAASEDTEPVSLMPPGRMTKGLDIQLAFKLGQVLGDGLTLAGVSGAAQIRSGVLKGDVNIAQVFGGTLQLQALQIPLLMPRTVAQGVLIFDRWNIPTVLSFAKPDFKDFAKGSMRGQVDFNSYFPSDPDFLSFLRAKGKIIAMPVTLSTVKVGDVLNKLAAKVPMVKLPPVRTEPLSGKISLDFDLNSRTMMVQKFSAQDKDTSLLELSGSVKIPELSSDLSGKFLWARPSIKGCFLDGNKDEKGRLQVPVALKGNLMEPSLSVVSDLVLKMGARTLACEQKRAFEEKLGRHLKPDLRKKIEEGVGKKLEGLFGK